MVLQGSNYNIHLVIEDNLLAWITSLLFSTIDSTTSDEICLSVPNLKMAVLFWVVTVYLNNVTKMEY